MSKSIHVINMFTLSQVRVNKEQDHVLISPRGLSFTEVTAGNLVSTVSLCCHLAAMRINALKEFTTRFQHTFCDFVFY